LTDTFDTTETFNGTENTEKEAKTPIKAPSNIAQELGNPEFIALGEKLIAENLDGVPEVDQQKFIETAWILIQNRNAGKSTPIIIIIRNNGMVDYGKQLGKITNDRYNGAVDIQTATNTQLETTNTELKATNAKLKATNAEL
jgi:hypothetical protein